MMKISLTLMYAMQQMKNKIYENIFSKHQPPSLLINAMGVDAKVGKIIIL